MQLEIALFALLSAVNDDFDTFFREMK